jgi:hypothetical protein
MPLTITSPSGPNAEAVAIKIATAMPHPVRLVTAHVTFDDDYPTGGYPLTPAMFGLTRITHVFSFYGANANGHPARLVYYHKPSQTLRVYTALSNQANNHSDQSNISVDLLVAGA